MKRSLILLIAFLMLSKIVTAQVTVSGHTEPNQKPSKTGQQPTTGTAQNYYVANTDLSKGTPVSEGVVLQQDVKKGDTIASAGPLGSSDLQEITPSAYNYAQKHNTYAYESGTFTYTSSKPEPGTIEDYRTDTTITIRADGSKTVDQRYYVCGQGLLASCEETGWVEQ